MHRFVAALLLATSLQAQMSEKLEVNILELDVVVVDRAGTPVDGLTRDDFDVQIAGRRGQVSNFYAVKRGEVVDAVSQDEAPGSRQALSGSTLIPGTVMILVDDTRLGPRSKQRAIEALKQYVRANVGPTTTALIARWNGSLDVRTRPTDRAGLLLAELDKMSMEPAMLDEAGRRHILKRINEAFMVITGAPRTQSVDQTWREVIAYADHEARSIERTVDVLREMVRLTGTFEGRKALVYVSEGLPLSAAAEVFDYWENVTQAIDSNTIAELQDIGQKAYNTLDVARYDRSRHYQRLAREAQAANVSFYAVDPGGTRGYTGRGVEEVRGLAELDSVLTRSNIQDGVRMVANGTGGRFLGDQNDLGQALSVLSEQFTTYYSIGIRTSSWMRLTKVRVAVRNRPELRVITSRHRRATSRQEDLERSLRARLYNQLAENPLGADLDLGVPATIASRCIVPVRLSVARQPPAGAANPSSLLALHFALLDDRYQESEVRSVFLEAAPGGLAHSMSLGLKPGRYMFSLALDDPGSGETTFLQREIDARTCR